MSRATRAADSSACFPLTVVFKLMRMQEILPSLPIRKTRAEIQVQHVFLCIGSRLLIPEEPTPYLRGFEAAFHVEFCAQLASARSLGEAVLQFMTRNDHDFVTMSRPYVTRGRSPPQSAVARLAHWASAQALLRNMHDPEEEFSFLKTRVTPS